MAKIDYSFGYKNTWFAIKNTDVCSILSVFSNLANICEISWKEGILEEENSRDKVFISGLYEGWSFLIGKGLCNPSQIKDLINLLLELGKMAEEVCYFSSYRTVETYGFAKVIQGKIIRLYCYSGEKGCIYKNMGEKTDAEKELELNFATNEDELFEEGFDEIGEDDILRLAGQLALNPELLIGMEERKSIIADFCLCPALPGDALQQGKHKPPSL